MAVKDFLSFLSSKPFVYVVEYIAVKGEKKMTLQTSAFWVIPEYTKLNELNKWKKKKGGKLNETRKSSSAFKKIVKRKSEKQETKKNVHYLTN